LTLIGLGWAKGNVEIIKLEVGIKGVEEGEAACEK